MSIIGYRVKHKTLGEGTIISQTPTLIEVAFASRTSKFQYPEGFESFLRFADSELQLQVTKELQDKRVSEQIAREKAATENPIEIKLNESSKPIRKKTYKRLNIAFKCNYCDGGKSDTQVGFTRACSDEIIQNNVLVEKRSWCTQEDCPCFQYINHQITRDELDSICQNEDEFVCYESQMLRNWRAFAGVYSNGDKKGEPMTMRQVQNNSLCMLTTREPGSNEVDRFVFGVFLVDEAYEGDETEAGFVGTKSKYRLKLSPEEAHKILFWNYYANSKQPEMAHWGTGLHRYIDDTAAVQVLLDISKLKVGTADEVLAKEFVEYFANANCIDLVEVPNPAGALTIKE